MHGHGVVHFEIPAGDPDKLSEFYTKLFDWQVQKMPMGDDAYYLTSTVETDESGMPKQPGINGGIYRRQSSQDRAINYVNVESVDEYVAKAKGLGASVLLDKTPIPGMGYFAQLTDPDGNAFGVFQESAQAA